MATIAAIRDALATRLETLDGVRAAQEWAGPINVSGAASVAIVEYAGTDYLTTLRQASCAVNFKVTMLVSKVSDRAGRDKLDAFADPSPESTTSIPSAVNGPLGGVVAYATVVESSEYREYMVDEQAYLGSEFIIAVGT